MTTLVLTSLPDANPSNPPAGWSKPAAANPGRILTGGFLRSSGTGIAIWVDNTVYSGNTLSAKFTHGINATQAGNDSIRVVFLNSSQNGYGLWLNQLGTEARIYKIITSTMDATPIATFTSYGTGYSQNFEFRCTNKATGTFQFLRNNVQIGSDVVDTTYTGLTSAGIGANGGTVRGTVEVGELYTVNSITNPVVMGSAISVATSGYSTVTGITAGGMAATSLSFSAGTTTATWPAVAEGLVSTIALPATGVTFSVTDGTTVRTITSNINLPANFASTEFGVVIDEPNYLHDVYPLTAGWYCYYDQTQLGGLTIAPDSSISYATDGTFTCFVHKVGGDNTLYQLNVTVSADVVEVAPVMPADTSVTVEAGVTVLGTFDADSGTAPITYSLDIGSTSLFSVDSSTGAVSFIAPAAPSTSGVVVVTATTVAGNDSQSVSYSVNPLPDNTPDNLVFTILSAVSSIETIAGVDGEVAITVTGGEYRINGGAYTSAAGVVSNDDTVQLSSANGDPVTVTVGTSSFTWTIGGTGGGPFVVGSFLKGRFL
jgi:hypothetical protein